MSLSWIKVFRQDERGRLRNDKCSVLLDLDPLDPGLFDRIKFHGVRDMAADTESRGLERDSRRRKKKEKEKKVQSPMHITTVAQI